MNCLPFKPIGEFIEERSERLRALDATIYSVTKESGFVRSRDLFDKQVFSVDRRNYKRVGFHDLAYNPSRINVGSIALCEDNDGGAVSPMYVIVHCKPSLNPRFLLYFLKSDTGLQQIRHRCEGSVRFQLKFRDLSTIPIYAPPLAEQDRIVKLMDEADALRKLRAQADRRAADLIPAIFQEMFGRKSGYTYDRVKLEQVAEVVSGVAKGRKFNGRQTQEVPYLRVANVQAGYLDLSEIKTIQALPEEIKELALREGDVLLTEGGDFDKLGRGAMLEEKLPTCIHQNHVFRVRVDPVKLDPVYFAKFLLTNEAREYFLGCAKRTTNLASINMTQLRALPLFLPPLSQQTEFVKQVSEIRAIETRQASSRRHLEDLFQSILAKAFNDQLVSQRADG